jgi:nitrogen regulatory protein P-II 1
VKKIEAIIREEKLEPIKAALEEKGIIGMTITSVSGRGSQKGIALQWRAGEYRVDFLPKTKIEIIVDDKTSEDVVATICHVARTGKVGDGKIFVLPVENAIRVRTGEEGERVI